MDLFICSSAHLLICSSSEHQYQHQLICSASPSVHMLICLSFHLLIYTSAQHQHRHHHQHHHQHQLICLYAHLLICSSAHLLISSASASASVHHSWRKLGPQVPGSFDFFGQN